MSIKCEEVALKSEENESILEEDTVEVNKFTFPYLQCALFHQKQVEVKTESTVTITTNPIPVCQQKRRKLYGYFCKRCMSECDTEAARVKPDVDGGGVYYVCTLCQKEFKERKPWWKHFHRAHITDRKHKCDQCSKTFKHAFSLNVHLETHNGKKYTCEVCNKNFQTRYNLHNHRRLHPHLYPNKNKCEICGESFYWPRLLKEHQMEQHQTQKPIHECPVCKKIFNLKRALRQHELYKHRPRLVARDQQLRCDVCDTKRVFASVQSLNKHKRLQHRPDTELICEICGKQLTALESFKNHMRSHEGLKPFECDVCGKRFTKKQLLVMHVRVHTGEKPYKCKICDKAFSQRSTLNLHMRYHTGERPHGCNLCEKRFVSKTLLLTHQKTNHKII